LDPKSQLLGIKSDFSLGLQAREKYFAALEMIRAHLHRCLSQVAKIGNIEIPNISKNMRYDEIWQLEAYEAAND
jgi:hypothetical protein